MKIDKDLLFQFEKGLNPQNLNVSSISATIIGYGEISAIFEIDGNKDIVYKRMPLFSSHEQAESYSQMYNEYCRHLTDAGINLPEDDTCIIHIPGRPVVLYIAQEKFPEDRLCHRLIHTLDETSVAILIERIVVETMKVWNFNASSGPSLELALDGQLSNWILMDDGADPVLYYIDTSTPLFRLNNKEQQDPELLLKSVPGLLLWMVRLFFLDDVMTRYYSPKLVFTDLAGNLYKEQKPNLIPLALQIINNHLSDAATPLTQKEVEKYYKEDKLIWTLILAFRRFDLFLLTKLFRKRYEFILPGKIKR